jgi:hemerythrin
MFYFYLVGTNDSSMEELFMKWRPDFELGIPEIDKQHKKIVELINSLNDAFMKHETKGKLEGILNEMAEYAVYHFKTEEKLFVDRNFPFAKEHIQQHQQFARKVQDYKTKHEAGHSVTFQVLIFLRKWLTDHILDSDREYVDIVKRN